MVGGWLLTGADLFFTVPLFFAFFFLQQANENNSWQPKGVHPPDLAIGTLCMALVVAGVGVVHWALPRLNSQEGLASFVLPARVGALAMIGGVVVEIWQLSHLGFGISDGSYASAFIAMQVILIIHVAITALWVISLANRAAYEARHPIVAPDDDQLVETPTPISALGYSYLWWGVWIGGVFALAWVVGYFL